MGLMVVVCGKGLRNLNMGKRLSGGLKALSASKRKSL